MNKIEAIRKQLIFCQNIDSYSCGIYCKDEKEQKYYVDTIQLLYPTLIEKIEKNKFIKCIIIKINNGSRIGVFITDIFNSRNSIVRNNGIIISEKLFDKYGTYQITPRGKNKYNEEVIIVKENND